jgi:hypothetical protein
VNSPPDPSLSSVDVERVLADDGDGAGGGRGNEGRRLRPRVVVQRLWRPARHSNVCVQDEAKEVCIEMITDSFDKVGNIICIPYSSICE